MTYDPTNRMTDPAWREKDFDRLSDVAQLLGNEQAVHDDFVRDHNSSTGAHGALPLSGVKGYAARAGLGTTPQPPDLNGESVQLIDPCGPNAPAGYLLLATVGASLPGVYEVTIGFGGDRVWCAYAELTLVAVSDP